MCPWARLVQCLVQRGKPLSVAENFLESVKEHTALRIPGSLPSSQSSFFLPLKHSAHLAIPSVHGACFTHRVTQGSHTPWDFALQGTWSDVRRQLVGCHPGEGAATSIVWWRPEMPLDIFYCTAQAPHREWSGKAPLVLRLKTQRHG